MGWVGIGMNWTVQSQFKISPSVHGWAAESGCHGCRQLEVSEVAALALGRDIGQKRVVGRDGGLKDWMGGGAWWRCMDVSTPILRVVSGLFAAAV